MTARCFFHLLRAVPLAALVFCVAGPAAAQVTYSLQHSIAGPPGVQSGGQLGHSVAVDGSFIVVGAPGDETSAFSPGVVKVFDSTTRALLYVLVNPTPGADDLFGWHLAISGTRVVVGAHGNNTGATDAGSAYVYDLSSAAPTVPVATLNNPSPAQDDGFGMEVAISGTRVVVRAIRDDAGAIDAGSAYVYDLSSATPTVPVATLSNPSPAASDSFGRSVAISGTHVAVGASGDNTAAPGAGSAHVYDLNSATPTVPVATLNNPGPASGDWYGISVTLLPSQADSFSRATTTVLIDNAPTLKVRDNFLTNVSDARFLRVKVIAAP